MTGSAGKTRRAQGTLQTSVRLRADDTDEAVVNKRRGSLDSHNKIESG